MLMFCGYMRNNTIFRFLGGIDCLNYGAIKETEYLDTIPKRHKCMY